MPLYATSLDTTIANDACTALPDNTPDLSKYTVLVRRVICLFADKAVNQAAKGAKYMIVYNNVAGDFAPTLGDSASLMKGSGMVTPEIGASWVNSLKAGSNIDFVSFSKSQAVTRRLATMSPAAQLSSFPPGVRPGKWISNGKSAPLEATSCRRTLLPRAAMPSCLVPPCHALSRLPLLP
ncbi:hypothetical protein J3459_015361 [Metarhizium acridum]|nr:hypothetical protein J3459_015361 [Metarhizium acridum]